MTKIPDRTIPPDSEKPARIAFAFMSVARMPANLARKVTARLYGFPGWAELNAAMASGRDAPDEHSPPEVIEARERQHVAVLKRYLKLTDAEAETAAAGLGPTNLGMPELDWSQDRKLAPGMSKQQLEDAIGDVSSALGVSPDFLDEIRASNPCHPEPWLVVIKERFGFELTREWSANNGPLERIAETKFSGETWPIYLTSIRANPTDMSDPLVHKAETDIATKHERALLLFDGPAIWVVPDKKNPEQGSGGVVYGGRILRNGGWEHFAFGRDGMASIANQRIRSILHLSSGFIEDHYFEDGLSITIKMAKETMVRPTDDYTIQAGTIRNWTIPVAIDAQIARLMRMNGLGG